MSRRRNKKELILKMPRDPNAPKLYGESNAPKGVPQPGAPLLSRKPGWKSIIKVK